MTPKDKKIIEDAEREGIPVFVFTAKDSKSLKRLVDYRDDCKDCSVEHWEGVEGRVDEWLRWQRNNPDKVKMPD